MAQSLNFAIPFERDLNRVNLGVAYKVGCFNYSFTDY